MISCQLEFGAGLLQCGQGFLIKEFSSWQSVDNRHRRKPAGIAVPRGPK